MKEKTIFLCCYEVNLRYRLIYRLVLVIGCFSGLLFPADFNITKVGEWGSGKYRSTAVQGSHAYCAASNSGLDIIDISDISNPKKIANYDGMKNITFVRVSDNYAYVVYERAELRILDVSNPGSPAQVWNKTFQYLSKLHIKGNFAYLAANDGLYIFNISNPANAFIVFQPSGDSRASDVHVKGSYAYVTYTTGELKIFDISIPQSPSLVGQYDANHDIKAVCVSGNYACLAIYRMAWIGKYVYETSDIQLVDVSNPASPTHLVTYELGDITYQVEIRGSTIYAGNTRGLKTVDFSNPSNPTLLGNVPGSYLDLHMVGNRLFAAAYEKGLQVFDLSDPASLKLEGEYDASGEGHDVCIIGNYAYMAGDGHGLQIIDVTNPSAPYRVGCWETETARGVYVSENYAYLAAGHNGLKVIDISNPVSPTLAGGYDCSCWVGNVLVWGNYAYVSSTSTLHVLDISTPSKPVLAAQVSNIGSLGEGMDIRDNYAYIASSDGLVVLDITSPTSPVLAAKHKGLGWLENVRINGNYAFCTGRNFVVVDIGSHSQMRQVGVYSAWCKMGRLDVRDSFAYVSDWDNGVLVFDVSNPAVLKLIGQYQTYGKPMAACFNNGYIYAANWISGKLSCLRLNQTENPAQIMLNKKELRFSAVASGPTSGVQTFIISNPGGGSLNWATSEDEDWLTVWPHWGTGSAEISVSINSMGFDFYDYLWPSTHYETVTISSADAVNSPLFVRVICDQYGGDETSPPFGEFSTPVDGSVVYGSIPVTGWVLDDLCARNVQIFREEKGALVYIGHAVFVEGARIDVEMAYPGYPNNSRAGWGYMMLTNFLPSSGNGTFKIHAVVTDVEGNRVTLGTKTIICDNANAVRPFGAIDTPTQGGTASGDKFVNWGWVLTPQPNSIPTDGSTINVFVDSVNIGHPTYNNYRADIATLFPGYVNTNGAVGYFSMDTTAYNNGVHTIFWIATDSGGNADGIGSRYFSIQNSGVSGQLSVASSGPSGQWSVVSEKQNLSKSRIDNSSPVWILKGYERNIKPFKNYPDDNGIITLEIKELERIEIHLADNLAEVKAKVAGDSSDNSKFKIQNSKFYSGYMLTGNRIHPLPLGSTLDTKNGTFNWIPGPGFYGNYRMVFVVRDKNCDLSKKEIFVNIVSKFGLKK